MLKTNLMTVLLAAAVAAPCCGKDQGGENEDADEVMDAADNMQESDAAADGDSTSDGGAENVETTDASVEGDGSADEDATIHGSVTLPFDLSVSGSGSRRVGSVALEHDWGPVQLGTAVPALAYMRTQWEEFDITLYHVLAPETGDLNVLYFYCGSSSSDSFDDIWHESYTMPLVDEVPTGTCRSVERQTTVDVELIDLESLPPPSELVTGFSVSGPEVSIGDAGGSITLGGRSYAAYPFETVDCTTICTADPADGWWELHMVLEEADEGSRCFGILYLVLAEPAEVQFAYGFCLRSLTGIDVAWLPAAWSAPGGGGGAGTPPDGPRHPRLGYVLRPGPPLR